MKGIKGYNYNLNCKLKKKLNVNNESIKGYNYNLNCK